MARATNNVQSCNLMVYNEYKKEMKDKDLAVIADNLIISTCFLSDLSLYTGKVGIAIFFCNYGYSFKNSLYIDFAGELIDEVYKDIDISVPINFETGVTGIGWGIAYLIHNNFMDGDSDEILAFVDEIVITSIVTNKGEDNDMEGIVYYILARLSTHSLYVIELFCNSILKKCMEIINTRSISISYYILQLFEKAIEGISFEYDWHLILSSIIKNSNCEQIGNNQFGLSNGCAGFALKKCWS